MNRQNPFSRGNKSSYFGCEQDNCQNSCKNSWLCSCCEDDKNKDECVICPTGPQCPIGETGPVGPQGPVGETGAQGPQGIAGRVLSYADFYALMPNDNSATVAPGADVSFP